jgi:hypothetical protein
MDGWTPHRSFDRSLHGEIDTFANPERQRSGGLSSSVQFHGAPGHGDFGALICYLGPEKTSCCCVVVASATETLEDNPA